MNVLIVEDNAAVRSGLERVLARAGFGVTTASNGLEALAKLEQQAFQGVVCDLMMPGMDGMTLFEQLEARHPEMAQRLLFVSAWLDDPTVQQFIERSGRPVLTKPFEIQHLISAVRDLVAEPSNDGR